MQLVEVVWNDAWADVEGFATVHGIAITHKPMVVKTLGWLVKDDEIGVSVANECSTDAEGETTFRGRTFVPRAMVVEVTPYNLSKPRKKKATDLVETVP